MNKLTKAIVLASAMTAGLAAVNTAQAEDVEVSASVAIANMYLWRGLDLGYGTAAVSGSLDAAMGGAYAGIWGSSGDAAAGTEYDLYVGYGGEVQDFSYDVMLATYVYPSAIDDAGDADRGNTFDSSEAILSLGYAGVSFGYYYTMSSNPDDNSYMTLGYGYDAFSATVGFQDSDDDANNYTHLDLTYAYNDNLSFTMSKVIDQKNDLDDGEAGIDEDMKFVFAYSLPIEM